MPCAAVLLIALCVGGNRLTVAQQHPSAQDPHDNLPPHSNRTTAAHHATSAQQPPPQRAAAIQKLHNNLPLHNNCTTAAQHAAIAQPPPTTQKHTSTANCTKNTHQPPPSPRPHPVHQPLVLCTTTAHRTTTVQQPLPKSPHLVHQPLVLCDERHAVLAAALALLLQVLPAGGGHDTGIRAELQGPGSGGLTRAMTCSGRQSGRLAAGPRQLAAGPRRLAAGPRRLAVGPRWLTMLVAACPRPQELPWSPSPQHCCCRRSLEPNKL